VNNKTILKTLVSITVALVSSAEVMASDSDRWFLRPYIGLSMISDLNATAIDVDNTSGTARLSLDNGYTGGLGVGYRFNEHLAAELAWEYRSNDSEINFANQALLRNGNYASNIFFLNGHYNFNYYGNWQPYVGAGLSWIQEIDVDFDRNGTESSFSSDGDVGYQVFTGVNYALAAKWRLQTELRYGSISNIELVEEGGGGGRLSGLEYKPFTVQVGLLYLF
jgi:outer membrane protein W